MARCRVGVKDPGADFNQRAVGIQSETGHHLQAAHRFHFPQPDGLRSVFMLLNLAVHRHVSGRPVVLWPVKLNAPGDPRPQQPHQRRLDHLVVVDKITLLHFVVGPMNAPTQLR
ncbi:hypothetical protein D3C75_1042120 [compost metagenome]